MIILDATTKSLQLKLGAAVTTNQLPFSASYVDSTGTSTTPGENDGTSNGTTAVTVAGSPASSTQRLIKNIVIQNADTAPATVTIIYNNNSTLRNIVVATLSVGDQLVYEDGSGWSVVTSSGSIKTTMASGGSPAAGTMFNLQQGQLTTVFTTAASSYTALTGLSVTITPTSASNSVLVRAVIQWGAGSGVLAYFQLLRGSTPIGVGTSVGSRTAAGSSPVSGNIAGIFTTVLEWLDSPATTSATTYSVQGYTNGGAGLSINASNTDSNSATYARSASTVTAIEVQA